MPRMRRNEADPLFAAGVVIVWAGYAAASWGVVLLHGWNITFLQWVNPLNPYRYPAGGPAPIPDNQILPGGATTGGAQLGQAVTGAAAAAAAAENRQQGGA